jgi:hypothetical protein
MALYVLFRHGDDDGTHHRVSTSEEFGYDVPKIFAHSDGHKDLSIEYMVQSLMLFYLIARRAAARQL